MLAVAILKENSMHLATILLPSVKCRRICETVSCQIDVLTIADLMSRSSTCLSIRFEILVHAGIIAFAIYSTLSGGSRSLKFSITVVNFLLLTCTINIKRNS